jgi:hypothetical protein
VAFDGPAPYRDVSVAVLDRLTRNGDGTLNLGWDAAPTSPAILTTLSVTAGQIAAATAANRGALLMFNFAYAPVATFQYTINGHAEIAPSPVFPLQDGTQWHSVALPVPFTDLVAGPQTIRISANRAITVANVNIVLIAGAPVSGGQSPTPPTNLRIVQ